MALAEKTKMQPLLADQNNNIILNSSEATKCLKFK
jgi:hypothetical protein